MLLAQVCRAGGAPRYLGIARDNLESLRTLIAEGLRSPVLILTGGVSAGKLDLVPGVLQDLGVQAHFHKVAMKPGKPVFFGTCGDTLVFGLPGNPISAYVCFELFVGPAIRRLGGHAETGPRLVRAKLAEDSILTVKTDRPTYHPARVARCEDGWKVSLVAWLGSSDLSGLLPTNAFALYDPGEHSFEKGQVLPVLCPDWSDIR
jgi:molybdopterin molybdotransferase